MKTVVLAAVLIAMFTSSVAAQEKPTTGPAAADNGAQQIVKDKDFAVAVPAGWRDNFRAPPRFVMFRNGDGIGVPTTDETGEPLQVGLTLERFRTDKSVDDVLKDLEAAAKSVPQLQLIGEQKREQVKLADGADAVLLTTEFIKQGKRHSLQLKLVAKNAETSNAFIVSSYAVGGKSSTWPTPASALTKWLRGHVTSFVLDPGKFDATKLPGAFEPEATAP